MTMVKQAFIELILLTVASVGVALAANQIRERKSIELTKDYFKRSSDASSAGAPTTLKTTPAAPAIESDQPAGARQVAHGKRQNDAVAPAAGVQAAPGTTEAAKKHLEHDFQTISVDEAHEVLDDPKTAQGLNVFVDARDEEHFAEGHIPGAMQCFPYESQRCLDRVMAAAGGAEKVIVYCGGGDCEDSIFMARELQEAGVPYEAIHLFEGGWKEWSAKGLHTETGNP